MFICLSKINILFFFSFFSKNLSLKGLQVLDSTHTSTSIHRQLHGTDLLVDLLHEVNDEVNQFVFVELKNNIK